MTNNKQLTNENVLAGTIGALLFSLAGGIVWFLLYQVGFMAGISGLVGVICGIKGYSVFAKKESLKGVIIGIVSAVLIMILAWYLCLSLDVYRAYQEWYAAGEVDFTLTYFESVQVGYMFLSDSSILLPYLKDLLIGLALCAAGAYRFVIDAVRRVKQEQQPEPAAYTAPEQPAPEAVAAPEEPTEPAAEPAPEE